MESGELLWKRALPDYGNEPDSRGVFVANGVLIVAMCDEKTAKGIHPGNNKVVASSLSDGAHLWEYDTGSTVWNFMPSTPGDGTIIFSTNDARAHRLDIQTGQVIWKANYSGLEGMMYSTGGGVLSPDGLLFYAAGNFYTANESEP